MTEKLTIGSLFSGYGGIELGLESLGMFRTIWHCEIEPYPSAVLAERWPGIPNLGDITKVDWARAERPDVLVGGFPCQDVSMAGKRKGLKHDTRTGLWYAFAQAILILRPRFVIGENVAGLLIPKRERNRVEQAALGVVLAQLSSLGYDAEWQVISAQELGAPHRRDRVFIVGWDRTNTPTNAYCGTGRNERQTMGQAITVMGERETITHDDDITRNLPDASYASECGCGEPQTNSDAYGKFREHADRRSEDAADTEEERREQPETVGKQEPRIYVGEGLLKRDGARNYWSEWTLEPPICRMDDGTTARMDRYFWREQIKALGNGVVPQCAKEAAKRMILPRL